MSISTKTNPDDEIETLKSEEVIWEGSPSQWANFGIYIFSVLFCWLIFPPFFALYYFLRNRSHRYVITTERFKEITGIFSRHREDLELYRVKDISMDEPFLYRLVGLGNIIIDTSDKSCPQITLHAIDAAKVIDLLHNEVERIRLLKRVREIDIE